MPETATGQLKDSGNIGPDVHVESSLVSISVPALAHSVSPGGLCYMGSGVQEIDPASMVAASMPQGGQSSPRGRVASGVVESNL